MKDSSKIIRTSQGNALNLTQLKQVMIIGIKIQA